MKARYLFLSMLASTALSISAADATVLLTFGQTSTGDTVTATRLLGTTTITSTDTAVDITQIAAPAVIPIPAFFDLTATSVGKATLSGTDVEQKYSGKFSITSGIGDTGANYLSGTFSDVVFGSGSALTLNASGPGESVTFSSSVIAADLIHGFNPAVALSFTDVTPGAAIVANTLRGFTSDVSGDFSNTAVPEPSTWAMMLLGFAGLGYAAFRRARARSAILSA